MNLQKKLKKLIFKPKKYITFKHPSNIKYKVVKETKNNYYIKITTFIFFPAIQRVSKAVSNIKFVTYECSINE